MISNGKNYELVLFFKMISSDRIIHLEFDWINPYVKKQFSWGDDCSCGSSCACCRYPKLYIYFGLFGWTIFEFSLFK